MSHVSVNPFDVFYVWLNEAVASEERQPHVMSLATVNEMGQPSVRLTEIIPHDLQRGVFSFCTHMESRKAYDIFRNPHVALCFHWKQLKRCVKVQGVAYTLGEDVVDNVFKTYDIGKQLSLWVTRPFAILDDPQHLHEKFAYYAKLYADKEVPRPPHWGGFCVQPTQMEFWQEDPFHVHTHRMFEMQADGWTNQCLYP